MNCFIARLLGVDRREDENFLLLAEGIMQMAQLPWIF